MTSVCFGRLVSMRRILVSAVYLRFSVKKDNETIADYENMNLVRKAKAAKIKKNLFSTTDFVWNESEFLHFVVLLIFLAILTQC